MRLAGNRAGEQRLAGTGRPHQQHALGNPSAQVRVLLRVLEKLDDLLQLVFGFVDAGDVREPHLHLIVGVNLRAAPRERHHSAFGATHPPEEEAPDADEEHQRNDPTEQIGQPAVGHLALVFHTFGFELLDELRVFDPGRCELLGRFWVVVRGRVERAANALLGDRHLGDLAVPEQRLELAVGERPAVRQDVVHLCQAEQQQKSQAVPQRSRRPRAHRPLTGAIATARIEPGAGFGGWHGSVWSGGAGRAGWSGRKNTEVLPT